jgi:hypothetical protein
VISEIRQSYAAQAYVGQDWVNGINHVLGR